MVVEKEIEKKLKNFHRIIWNKSINYYICTGNLKRRMGRVWEKFIKDKARYRPYHTAGGKTPFKEKFNMEIEDKVILAVAILMILAGGVGMFINPAYCVFFAGGLAISYIIRREAGEGRR